MIKTKVTDPHLVLKKQQQICKGAIQVCRGKSFHAATIREIAIASSMSLGSMYDYIEKKEDILFLVHKEILRQIYDRFDEAMRKHNEPVEQLKEVFESLYNLTVDLREETLFIYTETKSLTGTYLHEILKRESEFVDRIRRLIERGIRKGVFHCDSPDLFANIMVFIGTVIPLRGWNILSGHSAAEVKNMLECMILRYLGVMHGET